MHILVLASEAPYEDPFIKLQMAQLGYKLGRKEMALEMLNKIRNLEWSEIYYPDMKQ